MLRGLLLIFAAAIIEGLQICLLLGLMGIVSTASLIPFVAFAAVPIGSILGMVITTCLSFMAVALILPWLGLYGFWYSSKLWPIGIKMVPFLGGLSPTITIAVSRCVLQKFKDEHGISAMGAMKRGLGLGPSARAQQPANTQLAARAQGLPFGGAPTPAAAEPAAPARQNVPLQTKNFDGIRKPANDNIPARPQPYAQAA